MSIFDDIYTKNGWGFGSGHGSLPSVTKGYRKCIEDFIQANDISSVVDYGCGDWQFSRLINWGSAKYTGLDIVPSVIEQNVHKFGSERVSFKLIKPDTTKLPKADLLLVKDVLQHLSDDSVRAFINHVVPNYRFCLITNCIIPVEDLNKSIKTGEFRPLDLRRAPFNVNGAAVFEFMGPKTFSKSEKKFFPAWKKHVLLVIN